MVALDSFPASVRSEPAAPAREALSDEPSTRARACDQDFAIACRLVEFGYTDTAIIAVLLTVRNHANVHRNDYIVRTIAAARRQVTWQEEALT